ncbi:hypothetical protein [uncultured Draconibacterium sp.]|uniref:hypothetical protein n=1 Tax=uncultured Draconibacterium sp. TaxID=1573823 RepID=UPI00321674FB
MAYILSKIYDEFISQTCDLEKIVASKATEVQSLERDTHIEGCYIRFVVVWELFVEEYFLRCLCGGKTRSKKEIKPLHASYRSPSIAFKTINVNRKNRDKDFIDWLDAAIMKRRINDHFRSNSRVQKINLSSEKMYELVVIRNAIAHRSQNAIVKFEKFVKDQLGYLAVLNPSMADLLIQKKRRTNKLMFLILTEHFKNLANELTK